jgi:hypothetical protein
MFEQLLRAVGMVEDFHQIAEASRSGRRPLRLSACRTSALHTAFGLHRACRLLRIWISIRIFSE